AGAGGDLRALHLYIRKGFSKADGHAAYAAIADDGVGKAAENGERLFFWIGFEEVDEVIETFRFKQQISITAAAEPAFAAQRRILTHARTEGGEGGRVLRGLGHG